MIDKIAKITTCSKLPSYKDNFYVDKTKQIQKLLKLGTKLFLCRARREGKTNLISTIGHMYRGDKQIFENLVPQPYILQDGKWDWDGCKKKYHVLEFDFLGIEAFSEDNFTNSFREYIYNKINSSGIVVELNTPSIMISHYFDRIAKDNKKSVLLIDEYDHPINELIENDINNLNEFVSSRFKSFFSKLKEKK